MINKIKRKSLNYLFFSLLLHILFFSFIFIINFLNRIIYFKPNLQFNQLNSTMIHSKINIINHDLPLKNNYLTQIKLIINNKKQKNKKDIIFFKKKHSQKLFKNDFFHKKYKLTLLSKNKKTNKLPVKKNIFDKYEFFNKKENEILDNLLNKLSYKSTPLQYSSVQYITKNKLLLNSSIINYINKIKLAIINQFYDAKIYHGHICELNIKISPKGKLLSILTRHNKLNSSLLCNAAIHAAKTAKFPIPENKQIYSFFDKEENILIFKP